MSKLDTKRARGARKYDVGGCLPSTCQQYSNHDIRSRQSATRRRSGRNGALKPPDHKLAVCLLSHSSHRAYRGYLDRLRPPCPRAFGLLACRGDARAISPPPSSPTRPCPTQTSAPPPQLPVSGPVMQPSPALSMDPGHDDEQRRAIIIIATYVLFGLGNALALVSLGIRMRVKTGMAKKIGVDDGEYDLAFLVLHLGPCPTSWPVTDKCSWLQSLSCSHGYVYFRVLLSVLDLPSQHGPD